MHLHHFYKPKRSEIQAKYFLATFFSYWKWKRKNIKLKNYGMVLPTHAQSSRTSDAVSKAVEGNTIISLVGTTQRHCSQLTMPLLTLCFAFVWLYISIRCNLLIGKSLSVCLSYVKHIGVWLHNCCIMGQFLVLLLRHATHISTPPVLFCL